MATREQIKTEIERVPEERLEELYRVVKTFSQDKAFGTKESFLSRLSRIQIEGPEDFAANFERYTYGGDDEAFLSSKGLAKAYGENEPEYSTDLIKEPNPDFEGI